MRNKTIQRVTDRAISAAEQSIDQQRPVGARPVISDPNAGYYRVPHALAFSGLTQGVLYRLIGEGKIKKVKLGRSTLICGDSLRAFMARLREAA